MKTIRQLLNNHQNGDTIVEVLIAIAIAAFAIGLSYATAQRSLQQSITSREHNEALNLMENQIADLKIRFQDPSFANNFASKNHFCLDDNSKVVGDSTWAVYQNWDSSNFNEKSPLATSTGPNQNQPYYYDSSTKQGCQRGTDVLYYEDITTSDSTASNNPKIFHITVRWEKIGGGPVNQASLDYRLDSSPAQALAALTGGPPPPPPPPSPSCSGAAWTMGEDDTPPAPQTPRLILENQNGFRSSYGAWSDGFQGAPWTVDSKCTYTMNISTHSRSGAAPTNQQIFVELCVNITTACSLINNSSNPLVRSPLTGDITQANPIPNWTGQITLTTDPQYVIFKHCSLWLTSVGTCKTVSELNPVTDYTVTITPGP